MSWLRTLHHPTQTSRLSALSVPRDHGSLLFNTEPRRELVRLEPAGHLGTTLHGRVGTGRGSTLSTVQKSMVDLGIIIINRASAWLEHRIAAETTTGFVPALHAGGHRHGGLPSQSPSHPKPIERWQGCH